MPRRGRSQDTMAPTKKSAGGISILTAVEEHEEHQQQAAAGHEERQVHARLQDRPQDPLELQGNLHSGMVVEASKLSPAGAVWIEFGLTFFMAVLVMLNMAELSPAGEAPTQGMFDLNVKDKWDAWKAIQAKLDCSKIQGGRHGRLHHQGPPNQKRNFLRRRM